MTKTISIMPQPLLIDFYFGFHLSFPLTLELFTSFICTAAYTSNSNYHTKMNHKTLLQISVPNSTKLKYYLNVLSDALTPREKSNYFLIRSDFWYVIRTFYRNHSCSRQNLVLNNKFLYHVSLKLLFV